MSKHVLIVSGEPSHRDTLAAVTRYCGLQPTLCATADSAGDLLLQKRFAAVLCEDTLPDGSFRDFIADAARLAAGTPVIVVSRRGDWESYATARTAGANHYLAFPPYRGEVEQALRRVGRLSRDLATAA